MADTTKLLLQAQFGVADASLGGPGVGKKWQITNLHLCNTSASDVTFRLHHATAGVSNAANALYWDCELEANRVVVEAPLVVESGQTLRGLCSAASSLTLTLYGIESE